MKVTIRIDPDGPEEIVICVKNADERLRRINDAIASAFEDKREIAVKKGDGECYLSFEELLYFEASDKNVYAHTIDDCFLCPLHLYELEDLLPRFFLRGSKSVLVNVMRIRTLDRFPTGIAKATFSRCEKTVYISRMYYKNLRDAIEEMRLKT